MSIAGDRDAVLNGFEAQCASYATNLSREPRGMLLDEAWPQAPFIDFRLGAMCAPGRAELHRVAANAKSRGDMPAAQVAAGALMVDAAAARR